MLKDHQFIFVFHQRYFFCLNGFNFHYQLYFPLPGSAMFSTTGFVFHYQFCNRFELVPILNLVSQKCSFIFHYQFCFRLLTRLYFGLFLLVLFSSTGFDFHYFPIFPLLPYISTTSLSFVYCFCFILSLLAWFICLFLGSQ